MAEGAIAFPPYDDSAVSSTAGRRRRGKARGCLGWSGCRHL